ncbi:MAG TPA: hypothetical protein VJ990_05390 [Clostridia bacterium]|nr:hypothetical protein [Clostridia bacterium]
MRGTFNEMCELFNEKGYEKIMINSLFNQMTFKLPEDSFWRVRKNRMEILVHRETAEGYGTVLGSEGNSMEFLNNRRITFAGGRMIDISHLDSEACLSEHFAKDNLDRVAGFFIEEEDGHMRMGLILGGMEKKGIINGEKMNDGVFAMKGGNLCEESIRLYMDMTDVRVDAAKQSGKIEALLRERKWIL